MRSPPLALSDDCLMAEFPCRSCPKWKAQAGAKTDQQSSTISVCSPDRPSQVLNSPQIGEAEFAKII
jgi:hypothetical protein